MRELTSNELLHIHGGVSDRTKLCVEEGIFGATEGALLGGLVIFPFYAALTYTQGINAVTSAIGMFLMGTGILGGSLLGGFLGTGSGFLASYLLKS